MKYIKAGISKAGKPYKAFWSCPECKTTQNAKQGLSNQFSKSNKEGEQIKKVIDYKNGAIKQAQDRKEEGIAVSGAKRIAGEIVAAMIHTGELKGSEWFIKYQEIASRIYNFNPLENGGPDNPDEDFILPEDIN
ncbi:MAG: hypothetical protein NT096_16750 [Proteobacteria bacterium]|nr:hypothetical protein [Pseudomonadota bacterium]